MTRKNSRNIKELLINFQSAWNIIVETVIIILACFLLTCIVVEVLKVNGKFKCPIQDCSYESEVPVNFGIHWRKVCNKKFINEASANQVLTMNSSHIPDEQGEEEEEEESPDEVQEILEVDTNRSFIYEVNLIYQVFSNFQ